MSHNLQSILIGFVLYLSDTGFWFPKRVQ